MRPFSPLYYIKENKTKCFLLMFMIFLSFGVYLGGLYVTNPLDNWRPIFAYYDRMTTVSPATEDSEQVEYRAFLEEIEKNEQIEVLPMGEYNGMHWNSIMGFEQGVVSFTFLSVEDFESYCKLMEIDCDTSGLRNGSIILSEKFAENKGLSVGDTVDHTMGSMVYDTYTLDAITNEDGYMQYFINEEPDSMWMMLVGKQLEGEAFYDCIYQVQKQHPVSVYDVLRTDIEAQFETFNMIYIFVVVLLSVILAVTINAAFVGMYQRRNLEFAVYRAMGISKGRLVRKLVGELLWMDLLALSVGGAVFFLGLYLFNNLVLYPAGKYLRYYEPLALVGILLCNIVVFLPLMVTRSRQMLKADIVEY